MSEWRSVVALSGGVGGARLVHGLAAELPAEALTVVVNTGDDFAHWGLKICPDLDTVMYTLAGLSDVARGWGLADESFRALAMVRRYGGADWFQLGDRDIATHITRTAALARGDSLSQVTRDLCRALGIEVAIAPMADAPRPTHIVTDDGRDLAFQEWFVRERCAPGIAGIDLRGTREPAPGVLAALTDADLVVICPSNPYVSVDPILTLRGVQSALAGKPVVAVSPIIGGAAVKGPLADMLRTLTGDASARAVFDHYRRAYGDIVTGFVIDPGDAGEFAGESRSGSGFGGPALLTTDIIMRDIPDRARLAAEVLRFAGTLG